MLGKTRSRGKQQQTQTPLLVPDKVPCVEKNNSHQKAVKFLTVSEKDDV